MAGAAPATPEAEVQEGDALSKEERQELDAGFAQSVKTDTPPTGADPAEPAGEVKDPNATPAAAPAPAPAPRPDTPPAKRPEEPDYKAMYEAESQARKTLEGKYNAEVPRLAAEVKELKGKAAPAAPAKDPANPPAGDPNADAQTEEEVAFEKEMPTVATAVKRMLAREIKKSGVDTDRVKAEVEKQVKPALDAVQTKVDAVQTTVKPLLDKSEREAVEAHFSTIKGTHQDFDQIVGSETFTKWMDGLPSWQRDAARAVYDGGSAQQVIDLVSAYKGAAGIRNDPPPKNGGGSDPLQDAEGVRSRKQPMTPRSGAAAADQGKDDFGAGFALATTSKSS